MGDHDLVGLVRGPSARGNPSRLHRAVDIKIECMISLFQLKHVAFFAQSSGLLRLK
jgi:hypothetical protein